MRRMNECIESPSNCERLLLGCIDTDFLKWILDDTRWQAKATVAARRQKRDFAAVECIYEASDRLRVLEQGSYTVLLPKQKGMRALYFILFLR